MKRGSALNRTLDFYLGIPLLNLLAGLRRSRTYPVNPTRIGLLFNPALGDTLLASAAILDIRAPIPMQRSCCLSQIRMPLPQCCFLRST